MSQAADGPVGIGIQWESMAEAAARLRMDRNTLYELCARGEGPPRYRAGRGFVLDPAEVDAWIKSRAMR